MYEYLTAFDGVPVGKKVGENVGPAGPAGPIVGKKVGLTLGRRGVVELVVVVPVEVVVVSGVPGVVVYGFIQIM